MNWESNWMCWNICAMSKIIQLLHHHILVITSNGQSLITDVEIRAIKISNICWEIQSTRRVHQKTCIKKTRFEECFALHFKFWYFDVLMIFIILLLFYFMFCLGYKIIFVTCVLLPWSLKTILQFELFENVNNTEL